MIEDSLKNWFNNASKADLEGVIEWVRRWEYADHNATDDVVLHYILTNLSILGPKLLVYHVIRIPAISSIEAYGAALFDPAQLKAPGGFE